MIASISFKADGGEAYESGLLAAGMDIFSKLSVSKVVHNFILMTAIQTI